MSHDIICNPVVSRLLTALERLRNEQAVLLAANRQLVSYGITTGSVEVFDRVRAINAEAQTIAVRLHALGEVTAADDATQGWAIITPARVANEVTP